MCIRDRFKSVDLSFILFTTEYTFLFLYTDNSNVVGLSLIHILSAFGVLTVTLPVKSPFTFISITLFVDKVTSLDIVAFASISIVSLAFAFFNAS